MSDDSRIPAQSERTPRDEARDESLERDVKSPPSTTTNSDGESTAKEGSIARNKSTDADGRDLEKAPSALSVPAEAAQPTNLNPNPTALDDDFPDGGLRAWIVVAGAWVCSFVTWGFVNSYGVFVDYYNQHQLRDKSSSSIAFIGAFELFAVLFFALFAGKAFDAGYLRYLLIAGTVIFAAGLFGLANATSYAEIFLAQGVACGLAQAIVFLPAVSTIPHWFRRRRGLALGILATGSSVGGVVYPIMLNNFFNGKVGFVNGVRIVGALTVVLLIFATFALKTRLPVRKKGLVLDFRYFKEAEYSFLSFGVFAAMTGLYTPYFYLQEYALSSGSNVPPSLAFYGLAILSGSSLFGRVFMNWLADRYGTLTVLTPCMLFSAILIFVWLAAGKNAVGFVIFAVTYGIFSGALVSLVPACVAATTRNMNEIGVRLTMLFMCESMAGLAGTPIAGALYTRTGSYTASACFSGGMVMIGTLSMLASRYFVAKEKKTWKV